MIWRRKPLMYEHIDGGVCTYDKFKQKWITHYDKPCLSCNNWANATELALKMPVDTWWRWDLKLARWLGKGCWCCGRYTNILSYRNDYPTRAKMFNYLTWCNSCKFAACWKCGDNFSQNKPWLDKLVAKYQRKPK